LVTDLVTSSYSRLAVDTPFFDTRCGFATGTSRSTAARLCCGASCA